MRYLIVVDMQRDFVTGVLGTREAQQIVPAVVEQVRRFDGQVIFTRDTHENDYLDTQEGKYLPVPHCIRGSEGWQLMEELEEIRIARNLPVYDKVTFGCLELAGDLAKANEQEPIESIELIGVCTDICVVSNALIIKAQLPQVPMFVAPACCAGVTPQAHEAALSTMRSCQIQMR
ncbi:MAG: cysteine hydrolase [bacterium]|nr:cysteine hydrolase [bacterium]MCM1375660.1 cysteine hydrolase [Muribaculum sp.]